MALRLEPIRVATGLDEEGMLVYADDRLVAVFVRLSDAHEDLGLAGRWYLETSYGLRLTEMTPTFPDLDAAQAWIGQRVVQRS